MQNPNDDDDGMFERSDSDSSSGDDGTHRGIDNEEVSKPSHLHNGQPLALLQLADMLKSKTIPSRKRTRGGKAVGSMKIGMKRPAATVEEVEDEEDARRRVTKQKVCRSTAPFFLTQRGT